MAEFDFTPKGGSRPHLSDFAGAAKMGATVGAAGAAVYGSRKIYQKSPKAQAFVAKQKKKSAARKQKRYEKFVTRQTDEPGVEWNSLRGRENALRAREKASYAAEGQFEKAQRLKRGFEEHKREVEDSEFFGSKGPEPLRGIHGAFVQGSYIAGKEIEKNANASVEAAYTQALRRNSKYTNDSAGWRAKALHEDTINEDLRRKGTQKKYQADKARIKKTAKAKASTAKKNTGAFYYRTVKGKKQRVRKGKRR